MNWNGHPQSSPFEPHPWVDPNPFVRQDPFVERPDHDLALLGGAGPRPEDFPNSEQGRLDFYAAVRSQADMMRMQGVHHMHQLTENRQAEVEAADRRVAANWFILG